MQVVFHIISTGGGSGASRVTRYIAERDKDLAREGPGPRSLFSEDREGLTYRKADRILDPDDGQPEKNELLHFSVSFEEEDFDKLAAGEKEKQARLREVIREGMTSMAEELNLERLFWVAGIHRNSDNPHAHVVMRKDAAERGTGRERRIGRIRKSLLPHKQLENGRETIVPGKIGERFLSALERQKSLYLGRDKEQEKAQQVWERLVQSIQERRDPTAGRNVEHSKIGRVPTGTGEPTREEQARGRRLRQELDHRQIAASWNANPPEPEDDLHRYRIALGKRLEFSFRLAFTQVWYDRAVEHGESYRFNVLDQSTNAERNISEFDVRRRAAARATRVSEGDYVLRNQAIDGDLSRHGDTLRQLAEAREAKIASLEKDIAGLGSKLSKTDKVVLAAWQAGGGENRTPLLDRQTLSDLQEQAVRLNLPDHVSELEKLRMVLARAHQAPLRTDTEAAKLAAQLNVARADLMARDARLENFEASVHLTTYEVHDERWSLGALDKRIAHRSDDAKLVPQRAARLDLRSLARLNYSSTERQQAVADVEHLTHVRSEIVREIELRGEPLIEDRNQAREMVEVLEGIHRAEYETRSREGKSMAEPTYEPYQIKSLEASAETLRDPKLLREVHYLEHTAARDDPEINWEGRVVAREITSGLAVEETKERLQHFLESRKVASLHLGNHQTGTLREVESRTVTEYLARAILESREQRDHRHTVKSAAREHHGRLVNDSQKAQDYHEAARELASETKERKPKFTDKEKINLEIYAERQNDAAERERYLELARGDSHSQEREVAVSWSR
jgi:hypothetical protein